MYYSLPRGNYEDFIKEEGKLLQDRVLFYEKMLNIDLNKYLKIPLDKKFSEIEIMFLSANEDYKGASSEMFLLINAYHGKTSTIHSRETYKQMLPIGYRNIGNKQTKTLNSSKNALIWSFIHKLENTGGIKSTKEINNICFNELISFREEDFDLIKNNLKEGELNNVINKIELLNQEEKGLFEPKLLQKIVNIAPLSIVGSRL